MTTREEVLERDNFTCFMCAMRDQEAPEGGWGSVLDTHHMDGRRGARLKDASRMVTLCRWHHQYSENSPHGNPEGWKNNILQKVDKYLKEINEV